MYPYQVFLITFSFFVLNTALSNPILKGRTKIIIALDIVRVIVSDVAVAILFSFISMMETGGSVTIAVWGGTIAFFAVDKLKIALVMRATRVIVNIFLESLKWRDKERIMRLFADRIRWYIPGNEDVTEWIGYQTTKGEEEAYFDLLWSAIKPIFADTLPEDSYAVLRALSTE